MNRIRRGRSHDNLIRSAFILDSDNLGHRIVRGASFKFLGIALRTIITIASTAILARLLAPADFGYIAMATVITEFAALFGAFGFTDVLIQRRVINRLQLDTVFWAALLLSIALASIVLILSVFADWLFNSVEVGPLLRVLSLTFVINSLTAVPWVILSRLLRFRAEFWAQFGSIVVRSSVAIAFAYNGFGMWSLVAGALAGCLSTVIFSFMIVPFVPRFKFHKAYIMGNLRLSSFYFMGGVLYYVNMSADLILIGRYLGATSLGYYQNARSLTDEIRARFAAPLQNVLFPAFSSIQGQTANLQALFLRSGRILATIIFPVGFGVSATAADLVTVLYGDKWQQMIPMVSLFGLAAAIRGSTAIAGPLLNGSGRVGLALKYNLFNTLLMLLGVAITLQYGIVAVAVAVTISSTFPLIVYRLGLNVIGLNMRHMFWILGPPFAAASVMWMVIVSLHPLATSILSGGPFRLLALVAIGIAVYPLVLLIISRQHLIDLRQVMDKLLQR